MNQTAQAYRAELLMRPTAIAVPFRVAINGGCDLARKCVGAGDYIAEQIQMPLPNAGNIVASWTPDKHRDGSTFTATSAVYTEPSGDFIRFDNAHDRDVLHTDMRYHAQIRQHDDSMNLGPLQMVNRRRVALLSLMQELEQRVNWRIPVWLYMPWSMWWDEYGDFPAKLQSRRPPGVLMSDMCEAVMAHLSFNPESSKSFLSGSGMTKGTIEAIEEAVDRVVYSFRSKGTYEFRQISFGRVTVLPFPMYAPPGSKLEGPDETVKPLLTNSP